MTSEEIQGLQKQLILISNKVDHLDRKVELISEDLNVSRGVKIYYQLEEIMNYLKEVCKEMDEGQVSTMKYRMDNVIKNVEFISKKFER